MTAKALLVKCTLTIAGLVAAGDALSAGPPSQFGVDAPELARLGIAGDMDRAVDYAGGARAIFDIALNSQRFLLTFKGGGHFRGRGHAEYSSGLLGTAPQHGQCK